MAGRLTPELEDIIMHSVDDRGFADVGIDLKQDILRGMERDGVDINTPVQGTPLVAYLATYYRNYPTIRFLLEQDKDKAKSAPTRVALLNALLSGLGQGGDPKELILMLLDEGVSPNAVNAQGFTMFQVALGRGFFVSEAIVAKLIEKGAKVNGTTPGTGIPTLIYAVNGRASPEVIKVLIKNGVDIGAQYKGQTAKQIIEKSPMLKSDYLEILPRLSPELTDLTSFAKSGLIRKFPYGVETEVGKFLTGKTGTLKQQRDKLVGTGRGRRKKIKKTKRRKTRK
jgi:ankyrin repeat protein